MDTLEKNPLWNCLVTTIAGRRDVRIYLRKLFADLSIEDPIPPPSTPPRDSASLVFTEPSSSALGQSMIGGPMSQSMIGGPMSQSMIGGPMTQSLFGQPMASAVVLPRPQPLPGFRDTQQEGPDVLGPAIKTAEHILKNMRRFASLTPTTLRYFCKMTVEACRQNTSVPWDDTKLRAIVWKVVIQPTIVQALNKLMDYNVVSASNHGAQFEIAKKAEQLLHALLLPLRQAGFDLRERERDFLQAQRYLHLLNRRANMQEYIKAMLDLDLPTFSQEDSKAGAIVVAEGVCVSMGTFQLIFDILIHNWAHYRPKSTKLKALIEQR